MDASVNAMRDVSKSGVVNFLSGITGDSVKVTTKQLVYNLAHITGKTELLVVADDIEYIDLLEASNTHVSTSISAGISYTPGDGKVDENGKPVEGAFSGNIGASHSSGGQTYLPYIAHIA